MNWTIFWIVFIGGWIIDVGLFKEGFWLTFLSSLFVALVIAWGSSR